MKKFITFMLCAAMIASMTACGNNATTPAASNPETPATQTQDAAPATTEEKTDATSNTEGGVGTELIKSASEYFTPIENLPEITPEEEEAWKNEPAYNQTIRIGYNGGLCLGVFGIAQAKGFYEEEGLTTAITKMTNQTDALGTAAVDVAGDHIATLLVPTVNGVNMTFTTGVHTGCKTLYTLKDGAIKSTADLVGKTVGLPDGIGASDQNITYRFLNHDDIDPTSVKYKVVEASACILAMQNGEIDAATLSDQFAKPFMDDGTIVPIRSLTFDDDFKQEACCVHAINTDFLKANPITSKKLTLAFEKASNWMLENPEEAVKILQENEWASGEFDTVLEIFKTYNFGISDELTETTLRSIIDDYKSFGLIGEQKTTDELMEQVWNRLLAK